MVRFRLCLLALCAALPCAVAGAQDDPLVLGQGLPQQGETQQWAPTITPDQVEDQQADEYEFTTITGFVGSVVSSVVEWLLSPVCVFFNRMLDIVGIPTQPVIINAGQGAVGYCLGIADAWIPLHEIFLHSMVMTAIVVLWTPFSLIMKYFLPGIGG